MYLKQYLTCTDPRSEHFLLLLKHSGVLNMVPLLFSLAYYIDLIKIHVCSRKQAGQFSSWGKVI